MLRLDQLIAYSAPAPVLAAMGVTFYVYLPKFYADSLGLSLGTLGILILLSRVWDAVSDPIIGRLSDRSSRKRGRRKIWISTALPILILSFGALLIPPAELSPVFLALWFGFFSIAFFTAWTSFTVPYEAWGTSLSFDFSERNKLFASRDGAALFGTLIAATTPAMFAAFDSRWGNFQLSVFYASLLVVSTLSCLVLNHEPSTKAWHRRPKLFAFNRQFLILLVAYALGGLGAALPASLFLFYVEHVLGSINSTLFLALYFGIGILALPAWIAVARRIGKKQAWVAAMLINALAFSFVYFLGPGQETAFGVLISISALGYGASFVLPSSMQADVIDLDELETGVRREGQLVGVWLFVKKMSAAVGAALGFICLQQAGYEVGKTPAPEALSMLSFLYAAVPALCSLAAIVVALAYRLDASQHAEIRRTIELRQDLLEATS